MAGTGRSDGRAAPEGDVALDRTLLTGPEDAATGAAVAADGATGATLLVAATGTESTMAADGATGATLLVEATATGATMAADGATGATLLVAATGTESTIAADGATGATLLVAATGTESTIAGEAIAEAGSSVVATRRDHPGRPAADQTASVRRRDPVVPAGNLLARGDTLGRYVVLALLGAGGMGEVYAAYDPELDRRVALKVIRPQGGGTIGTARARLLAEAQALARLSHPNVVSVYDVGTVEGDVYIAMEFVDGATLTGWLELKPRPWPEVVEVFTAAGRGLEAAHAAGLVHRDFKPDNVILGKDGRVRVIDFGVAFHGGRADQARPVAEPGRGKRKTRGPLAESIAGTALVGTPAFMAPEQFVGEEVGPATDQFSFAIALYIGLWRQKPFAGDTVTALAGSVCDGEIAPIPDDSEVPGFLRVAVLRALSVKPADRFAGMAELLAAIAPPAPRRARWPIVAAAAAVALAAVVGVVVAGRGAATEPCTGVARELDGVWDAARRGALERGFAARPEAFASVARILDRYTGDWVAAKTAACRATHVTRTQSVAVLERRVACLDGRLRQVDALAAVLSAGGDALDHAVEAASGLSSLGQCDNLAALGSGAPPIGASSDAVHAIEDGLARVSALRWAGDYKDAHALAERVVADAEALGWGAAAARALVQRGVAESLEGAPQVARDTLLDAVRRAIEADATQAQAEAWIQLVGVEASGLRQPSEALRWAALAGAALGRAGDDQELAGLLAYHRAGALRLLERYDEALARYQDARALFAHALGADHQRVALARASIGNMLRNLGKPDEAAAELEAALAMETALFGPDHPSLGATLNNLSLAYSELGRFDDAQAALERGLAIKEKELGAGHPSVAPTLLNLAALDRRRGAFELADRRWQRAHDVRVAALGAKHPDVTRTLYNRLLDRANRGLDVEALDQAAEVIARLTAQDDAVELGSAIGVECELLRRGGALARAEARCARAVAVLGDGGEPGRLVYVHAYAARLAADRGDRAEAERRQAAAEAALARVKRDAGLARAQVEWSAARVERLLGRPAESAAAAAAARARFVVEGAGFAYYVGEIDRFVAAAR